MEEPTKAGEKVEEPTASPPPSEPKKATSADIQASELFRRTQAERDRERARAEKAEIEVQKAAGVLRQVRGDRTKAALKELGDEPAAKEAIRQLEEAEDRLAAAETKERELSLKEDKLILVQKEVDVSVLSRKYDVPPEKLEPCESYAEMERLAEALAQAKQVVPPEKPKVEETKEPAVPEHVDSGTVTAPSGERMFKASEIRDMTPDQRLANGPAIAKAFHSGRVENDI